MNTMINTVYCSSSDKNRQENLCYSTLFLGIMVCLIPIFTILSTDYTRIIMYASLSSYGGLDIERGGFNQSESGMQEDGSYKFVWDFSTSQANGEIKAIGLCPSMMGKVGMSNATVSSEKLSLYVNRPAIAPFDTNCNLLPRSGDTEGFSNYGYNIVAVDGNIAYALHVDNLNANSGAEKGFVKNGGILKVFRFDVGMTGIGLKSKVGCANYIDCIDVKLPDEFLSTIQDNGNDKYGINYLTNTKKNCILKEISI